jgi:2-iminobutanoate/2-iminopropanoate deaminase
MTPSSLDKAPVRIVPASWDPDVSERFGYSFGMKWGGLLWIAGQVSMDEHGLVVGHGDIEAQTRRVWERIRAILEAGGATMANVVRTTTYITDRSFRPITNELRREYFDAPNYPTNTLVIVAGLAMPEYLVEIDAIAMVGE